MNRVFDPEKKTNCLSLVKNANVTQPTFNQCSLNFVYLNMLRACTWMENYTHMESSELSGLILSEALITGQVLTLCYCTSV